MLYIDHSHEYDLIVECDDGCDILYSVGYRKPNYPVPSIYCSTLISNRCDERSNELNVNDMVISWIKQQRN